MPLLDLKDKYAPASDEEKIDLPPIPARYDLVIAFDQALVHTGVAVYDGTSVNAWTLRAPKETETLTGHARTFARSVALQGKVVDLLEGLSFESQRALVAYEAPPAAKGRITRPESSILGAHCVEYGVHQTARVWTVLDVMCVSGQRAKTLVTGNAKADKAEVRRALIAKYNPRQVGACSNEHERDALLVALAAIDKAGAR